MGIPSFKPNLDLWQGSGVSPPVFMALSSLIVNAYHCMGHEANILLSYTLRFFVLAAIIYIDNKDLLHWPASLGTNPKELITHVQKATTDYGCLLQASGRIFKGDKCSVYFMDYKFVPG
jgi:hypothetical protein